MRSMRTAVTYLAVTLGVTTLLMGPQAAGQVSQRPWMNTQISAAARAELVLQQLTLDEKISLLHGEGMRGWIREMPNQELGNGGAGFIYGIPRLGIPFIEISDAAYGVRSSGENGRYSTAFAFRSGVGGKLGYASSLCLRGSNWPGVARTGLQHVSGRRRKRHKRAAQRKNL